MPGGRPRVYDNAEDLQNAVDLYFVQIVADSTPATVTGLALALGFESRQSVYDYEKDGEFSYIIKNARLRVECEYEKKLTTSQSPTGSIFALKNMGWKDKSEQQISMPTGLTIKYNTQGGNEPLTDGD